VAATTGGVKPWSAGLKPAEAAVRGGVLHFVMGMTLSRLKLERFC
jgi:hypothetical protein